METPGTPASGDIAGGTTASTASPSVSTETSGTTQAPATQATAAPITDSTTGEPPKERWADILANTRQKEREAALNEWRQQYGWAESVDRNQLEQMAEWYGRYNGDAGEFMESILQESLQHPVHGASVRSRLGRMLSSLRAQQTQPLPEIEPDIPVMDSNGNVVNHAYSAKAMKEIVQREIQSALGKEVAPLKEDYETRKAKEEREERRDQAYQQADADVEYVKSMPGFTEHKADILATFKANPRMTIRQAYDEVLKSKIFPGYGQKAEAKVLSDLQQKANAQTVNPGTPSGSAKPKFKDFGEAARYYAAHPEEAAAMANR